MVFLILEPGSDLLGLLDLHDRRDDCDFHDSPDRSADAGGVGLREAVRYVAVQAEAGVGGALRGSVAAVDRGW